MRTTVGVGFDDSAESRAALRLGGRLAREAGAALHVVSVASATVPEHEAAAIAEGATYEAVAGTPAAELARRSADLDLLVVGSRAHGPGAPAAARQHLDAARARGELPGAHRAAPGGVGARARGRPARCGGAVNERLTRVLPPLSAAATAIGGAAHLAAAPRVGDAIWAAALVAVLVPLTVAVARSLRAGDVGVDAIALLAMAGALALGELLAGAVVALMLSGGNALEATAARRAKRELTALLQRAPRIAHRRSDGGVQEVAVDAVLPGDVVVVRSGEVVPVDGTVASTTATIDESALTGEPLPVACKTGDPVRSGTANAGEAFDLQATRRASESAYAAIVRLVRDAEHQRAPFVRMADRYAAFLLPVTVLLAGGAWAASGDAVRALAVLVVATPCPLILAAPIALVSGVSRAARVGIVVKGAGVIEQLGRVRTVLLDKTGTLTLGAPAVERIVALDGVGPNELLRLAASVDELSAHIVAEALVHDAEARGLILAEARDVHEAPRRRHRRHRRGPPCSGRVAQLPARARHRARRPGRGRFARARALAGPRGGRRTAGGHRRDGRSAASGRGGGRRAACCRRHARGDGHRRRSGDGRGGGARRGARRGVRRPRPRGQAGRLAHRAE